MATQSTEAHTDVRKFEISRIANVLKNNVVAPFFVSVLFSCALTSQFFYLIKQFDIVFPYLILKLLETVL